MTLPDPAARHVFLSEHCAHARHDECPGACAYCPSRCACVCHLRPARAA